MVTRYNGLRPPYALAVGRSLLILFPDVTVPVQKGDTLFSLAQRFRVSVLQLLRLNPQLGGSGRLQEGETIVISLREQGSRPAELSGYAYSNAEETVLRGILPYATFLVPFSYGVGPDGALVPADDLRLVRMARQYGTLPLMHLSTITEDGSFSTQRASDLLVSPQKQAVLADAVTAQMLLRGYEGLDMDFEFVGKENAQAYAAFAGLLRERVNALGYELITALAPKTSPTQPGVLYEGHNYAALAQNSDAVLLMTYEWGYTYGPAMAVAPLPSVRRVLDYAVTEMPREKIFLGFPNYGYNWTLPYVAGQSRADSIGNEEAVAIAIRYGAEIYYDETSQAPYFYYTDEENQVHEVWFEDARSCFAKFSLLPEYGFRGVGFWNFMPPFTTSFSLLTAMFDLVKGL
jgi:spore germination protein